DHNRVITPFASWEKKLAWDAETGGHGGQPVQGFSLLRAAPIPPSMTPQKWLGPEARAARRHDRTGGTTAPAARPHPRHGPTGGTTAPFTAASTGHRDCFEPQPAMMDFKDGGPICPIGCQ